MGALETAATSIAKQLEEAAWTECIAHERFDLLDAIREGGYEIVDRPDGWTAWIAGGQTILVFRIGPHGELERGPIQ